MTLNTFLCTCWPFVCPLWRNVFSGLLPIIKLDFFFFFGIEVVSSLYSLDINPLIVHIIWEYFLPFSRPSFGCLTLYNFKTA